jgi:hypothetical protein
VRLPMILFCLEPDKPGFDLRTFDALCALRPKASSSPFHRHHGDLS